MDLNDLETAVSKWQLTVNWLEKGWKDFFEDYLNDVSYREDLQKSLEKAESEGLLNQEIIDRVAEIDQQFKNATEASKLCIWDAEPKFIYLNKEQITIFKIDEYDPDKYWYYYRWQPDCPWPWKGADATTYQKQIYGLDYENMSCEELREAVHLIVMKWHKL